jgi:hypothetical protein
VDKTDGTPKPEKELEVKKEGPKRFTLDFPEEEWKPLRDYAKSQKCPVSSIVRLACEAYMIEKGMITKPGADEPSPDKGEG